MSVVERVMKAYASKHNLTPAQAAQVRLELSKFINELMSGKHREPAIPADKQTSGVLELDPITQSEL